MDRIEENVERTEHPRHRRGRRELMLLAGALAAALAVLVWNQTAELRAVRGLPPAERAVIFTQTQQHFRTLCAAAAGRGELEAKCQEQARFLSLFPECGEPCQAELGPYLQPSR